MNTPLSPTFIGVYRDKHIFQIIMGHLLIRGSLFNLCWSKNKKYKKNHFETEKNLCLLYGYVIINSLG